MKPSRLLEVLDKLLLTQRPIFIWGPPGVGKSSCVRLAAQQRGWPVVDIRASLLDPTDLRGIPAVVDGRAVWCPPSFLPKPGELAGLLFFDELNAAPPLVQASLYQLTLDRRVGEYVLPEGWRIVAAGNRAADRSLTYRLPAALANRFIHLDFEVDFADWRTWAGQAGVHPLVIGFLSTRPELLLDLRPSERGFPTPRAWEMVSDALKVLGEAKLVQDVLIGIVGEGTALELVGYCAQSITEVQIRSILDDPESAELPNSLGDQYALIAYIVAWGKEQPVQLAAAKLLDRLSPELGVLLVRDLLQVDPMFIRQPGYKQFVARHGDWLR